MTTSWTTDHRIDKDSVEWISFSTDYQRLTLKRWFTNLERTTLNRCQRFPAPHKRQVNDLANRRTVQSADLSDGLGWERLESFRLKQLALLMYKIRNNLSPLYVTQIFYNISTVHTHNLRNSESTYYIPRLR